MPLNYYNQVQRTSLPLKMSSSEKGERNRVLLKRVNLCHRGHLSRCWSCCSRRRLEAQGSALPVSRPARKPLGPRAGRPPQPAQLCSCRTPPPPLGFSHHLPPALLSTRARSPESTDSRGGDGRAANRPFIISVTQKGCHDLCSLGLAGGPHLTLTEDS